MMSARWLLIILAIALTGTWLGAMMTADPGYVLFTWRNTTVEMSLWTWLLLSIIGFYALYLCVRLSITIGYPWHWVSRWSQASQSRQENKHIRAGICAFYNGDYQRAVNKLQPISRTSATPWLVMPILAHAQSCLGMHDEGLERLQGLLDAYPNTHGLVYSTMADIYVRMGDNQAAIATLHKITASKYNHQTSTKLLTLLEDTQQWLEAVELLGHMASATSTNTKSSEPNMPQHPQDQRIYQHAFMQLANAAPAAETSPKVAIKTSVDNIVQLWRKSPKHIQASKACQMSMAQALQTMEAPAAIYTADFIERTLNQQWSDSLALHYSSLPFIDLQEALNKAEAWQTVAKNSASLHLCLGLLCKRLKYWGKASDYLQKSIALQPSKAAHAELGGLLQQQGDQAGAITHLQLASATLDHHSAH